jgi:hypothetical protein
MCITTIRLQRADEQINEQNKHYVVPPHELDHIQVINKSSECDITLSFLLGLQSSNQITT